MTLSKKFTKLMGIKWPIVQAPILGGYITPKMIAAVSNSGCLGSLAAGKFSIETLEAACLTIQSLTNKPFVVNLFVDPKRTSTTHAYQQLKYAHQALVPSYTKLHLNISLPEQLPISPTVNLTEQIGVLIRLNIKIVSFTFGLPSREMMAQLKRYGIIIIANATTLEEAELCQRSSVDAIVLQGREAGGHSAAFIDTEHDKGINLAILIQQARDRIKIPIIAAGGIMDGFDIAKYLNEGFDAAQLGTAFLFSKESQVDSAYEKALSMANIETELSQAFTGKDARVITNGFTKIMRNLPTAEFPIQAMLTAPILNKAYLDGDTEFLPYWAGKGVCKGRKLALNDLLKLLIEELRSSLNNK